MDTRKTPLQIGFRQVSWLVSRKWSGKLHFLCPLYSRNVSQNWAQWLLKSTKYFSYRLKYKVEKYHYRYCRFLQFPVEWFHRCWTHLQTYWDAFSVVYITGGWMLQWHCRRNHTDMNKQMTWHDGVDQGLCHFFLWCGLKSLKNKKKPNHSRLTGILFLHWVSWPHYKIFISAEREAPRPHSLPCCTTMFLQYTM